MGIICPPVDVGLIHLSKSVEIWGVGAWDPWQPLLRQPYRALTKHTQWALFNRVVSRYCLHFGASGRFENMGGGVRSIK